MDVAIIDAVWNGVWQSMKIANAAEAFEVNVAPHNFYGHLCSFMNVHFAAAVPNLRIMEIDIDRLVLPEELDENPHPLLSRTDLDDRSRHSLQRAVRQLDLVPRFGHRLQGDQLLVLLGQLGPQALGEGTLEPRHAGRLLGGGPAQETVDC